MKKPVVDFHDFRLSRLNDPRYSHLLVLLLWIPYFLSYFLTENLIPYENCHIIHSAIDDLIPFCEYFLIPYTMWYLLIVVSLIYFALYDPKSFKNMQYFISMTQLIATVVYILYPSIQTMRPESFEKHNFFTWVLGYIYAFDTPTNIFPSLHCTYSIGIASVWSKKKDVSKGFKIGMWVLVFTICISTAFVKQHSVLDFFAAIPVCIVTEAIIYGKSYWKNYCKKS